MRIKALIFYKMKNVSLKNSAYNFEIFKTNNTFAERKINLGISYVISGLRFSKSIHS